MLTIPSNSLPFVNHVIRSFDELTYPGTKINPIKNHGIDPSNGTPLPAVLQTEIYDYAANISDWIAATGQFHAGPKDSETQKAIRESALHRLRQLGVEHAHFRNPTEELMEHVFITAYTNASSKRKEEMIRQMVPLNTDFVSTATRRKRLALKATLVVSKLFQNWIFKALASVAMYFLTNVAAAFIILGLSVCLGTAFLFILSHSPPLVARGLVVLGKGFLILIAGQPIIFVISRIGILLTRRRPAFQHRLVQISNILLVPAYAYTRFCRFIFRPMIATPAASNRIGRSLENIQNRHTVAFDLEQGMKGRALWLRLTTK